MTNEELRERLTGDDGGVRKRCEACGGLGHRDSEKYRRLVPCPDCDGGWVYDEGRLAAAIGTIVKCLRQPEMPTPGLWILTTNDGHYEVNGGMTPWNNRHGKPWQSALEAHVEAYREPAPDYRADYEALKAALRDVGYRVDLTLERDVCEAYVMIGPSIKGRGTGDTEAEALYAAVCAAVEQSSNP